VELELVLVLVLGGDGGVEARTVVRLRTTTMLEKVRYSP
jgi:hypothetical protein